jgi:hypothetical protein
MAHTISLTNPPNPTSVHAGNDADETFFDSLCETLNGAHTYGSLHAFSQYWGEDIFVKSVGTSGQMTRHRVPIVSYAHNTLKVVFRGRHSQVGSSYGRFYVNVYNEAGTFLANSYTVLSNSSTNALGTVTISGIALSGSHVRIRMGMLTSTSGSYSYISDVSASWVPLSSVETTKSDQGAIIPVGSDATKNQKPISAALGYCLMTSTNSLLKRLRSLGSISGASFTSSSADNAYISPFPLCQIVRMNATTETTRVYWWALALNGAGTAQDFVIAYGNLDSLFQFTGTEPNGFTVEQKVTQTVPAYTTDWYNGYIDIPAPIQRGRGMHERFIFLTCSTPAMSRPDAFGISTYNAGLVMRSVSFWSE